MNMRLFLSFFIIPLSLIAQSVAERLTTLERSFEQPGLVYVRTVVPGVYVSLMYARPDNFVGRVLYTDLHHAYLLPETARALRKAQNALQRKYPDYALKVYDATRPMRIQQRMWNVVAHTSKNIYVSNPAHGGGLHNYGLAVDLTLIDYLGPAAHVRDEARWLRRGVLRPEHVRLRRVLREAMSAGGFRVLPTEWWHFNFKTRAQARAHYTPIP